MENFEMAAGSINENGPILERIVSEGRESRIGREVRI
jgi:hypothetical protein